MSTDKPSGKSDAPPSVQREADIVLPKPPPPAPHVCDDSCMQDDYKETASDEDHPENYADLYDAEDARTADAAAEPIAPVIPPPPSPPPTTPAAALPLQPEPREPEPSGKKDRSEMTLWEHLEDLRNMLLKCLGVFVLCTCIIGIFFSQANDVLLWPLHQALGDRPDRAEFLRMNTMFGVFSVIIEIAVVGGFLLAFPFILYFLARFIAPGLTEKEKRILVPCCVAAFGLFLFGVVFSYFLLLPTGISVALSVNESMGFFLQPNVQDYYNLVVWMLGGVGMVFEFPLLLLVLIYLEIITPQMLKKYRRHVIVVIFIVAAVATPPDVVSQVIMVVPLYLLYEATVIVGKRLLKRKREGQEKPVEDVV